MKLRFLGGANEVGRSAILVNDTILLDYGMMTATPPQFPVGHITPEAIVASHGHLDHVGAIPALLSGSRRPPIHWTGPTAELALLLARDTLSLHGGSFDCPFTAEELKRVTQVAETHAYGEPFTTASHEITFYNAGHIPGSAHVLVDDGETRLLYTADFHTDDQRLVSGTTARPDADVVITESTYADIDHPDRAALERQFAESVRTTLWEGGAVIVPAFAIGRTQELMLICEAHDIECYVDGMGVEVTGIFRRHPEFIRDPEALRRAKSNARYVTGRDGQRGRILEQHAVIITTAGMLSGGPALSYLPKIRTDPVNKICLTGYQVVGTPGRELLDTGRMPLHGRIVPVSAQVEAYDYSAHADRTGLRSFLDAYRGTELMVVHGDRCGAFAETLRADGHLASAPVVGDVITV